MTRVALHPTPASPPTAATVRNGGGPSLNPMSSRNWALASAAYGICWLVWIVGVVIMYEIVYSWWRRWRCSTSFFIIIDFFFYSYSFKNIFSSKTFLTLNINQQNIKNLTLFLFSHRTSTNSPLIPIFPGSQPRMHDVLRALLLLQTYTELCSTSLPRS